MRVICKRGAAAIEGQSIPAGQVCSKKRPRQMVFTVEATEGILGREAVEGIQEHEESEDGGEKGTGPNPYVHSTTFKFKTSPLGEEASVPLPLRSRKARGSFFSPGDPSGLVMVAGRIVSSASACHNTKYRSAPFASLSLSRPRECRASDFVVPSVSPGFRPPEPEPSVVERGTLSAEGIGR